MLGTTIGTPLEPSRICLGSVPFGSYASQEVSFAIMDAYFELGGSFIDTAHIYAAWVEGGVGASERTVGEWIRSRGVRGKIVLGTKGGHPPIDAAVKVGRLSRADLNQDLSESLDRLGLDQVDLYWLHFDEPARPVGEIIESLASLTADGRIRAYGASNWATERLEAANQYAREHRLAPFVASQPWFSLGALANGPSASKPTTEAEDLLRAWHVRTGLTMVPYSSQANGYFGAENAAWARGGFAGEAPRAPKFDSPANRRRLLRAIGLAEARGVTANQIALAYLLSQPFPIYPIIGTTNAEHLRDAMGARDLRLTEEERASLFR